MMHRYWHEHRAWLLILLSAGWLGACSNKGMSDLEAYVAEVKARDPGQIEPLPEIKQVETYVYRPEDRRSPFILGGQGVQQEMVDQSGGIAPDPLRRKEELETYPLDTIRMVGTLERDEEMSALVRIQDGTLFRISPGNYMGMNHGQITRITEERIELTEIVSNGMGGWQERQAAVALSE
jgi:type IV pilus assembly protein PilP